MIDIGVNFVFEIVCLIFSYLGLCVEKRYVRYGLPHSRLGTLFLGEFSI